MSLARIYTTKGPVRKDGLTCGRCGDPIVKGKDRRRTFAVGFRGWEQTRCMKPECTPSRSELESSLVASVYGVIDGLSFPSMESVEDLESARDEVVAACEEVADEYEQNEMFEINYDLQERAETIRSAGDELQGWEPDGDEPEDEVDCDNCGGSSQVDGEDGEEDCEECEGTGTVDNTDAKEEWFEEQREALREAVDGLELP